ncbi:MAG: type II toxin-antitoxin system MqsA family antitoxin [Actinobacteria bacterium]|nr:type II toxin-antitoxin system MqsA family antitoxin [Actinomycetota bacterium]
MTCPICRSGRLQAGVADSPMTIDGMTLVVQEVPASICDTCGEHFFDADVTQRLLDLAREAAKDGVVVDVRRYVAA